MQKTVGLRQGSRRTYGETGGKQLGHGKGKGSCEKKTEEGRQVDRLRRRREVLPKKKRTKRKKKKRGLREKKEEGVDVAREATGEQGCDSSVPAKKSRNYEKGMEKRKAGVGFSSRGGEHG